MSAFRLHRSSPSPPAGLMGPDAMEIFLAASAPARRGARPSRSSAIRGRSHQGGSLRSSRTWGPSTWRCTSSPSRTTRQLATSVDSSPGSSRRDASRRSRSGSPIRRWKPPPRTPPISPVNSRGRRTTVPVGLYVTVRRRARRLEREVHRVRAGVRLAPARHAARDLPSRSGLAQHAAPRHRRARLRRTFDTALGGRIPVRERRARIERRNLLGTERHGRARLRRSIRPGEPQPGHPGRSGAGKSYLAKLQILRSLYEGVEVLVIDPEDEYRRPAEAVGGVVVKLGSAGERLNPLDLSEAGRWRR